MRADNLIYLFAGIAATVAFNKFVAPQLHMGELGEKFYSVKPRAPKVLYAGDMALVIDPYGRRKWYKANEVPNITWNVTANKF